MRVQCWGTPVRAFPALTPSIHGAMGPLSDRQLADLHAVLWPARHPLPLRRNPLASSLVLLHTAIQTLSNWHIFEAQDLPMK